MSKDNSESELKVKMAVAEKISAMKQRNDAQLTSLRAAIDEGDSSGIADGDVFGRVRLALNLYPNWR